MAAVSESAARETAAGEVPTSEIQTSEIPAFAGAIPVLDIGPYLAGEPGALERLAAELRVACETVGFHYLANHGIPWSLVERTFEAARQFHAQPLEEKLKLKINEHNIGYLPMRGATLKTSSVGTNTKPNANEALFVKRERSPDDPRVLANQPFCGMNQWPDAAAVPGFRETVIEYTMAVVELGRKLAPVYAVSLGLPADYLDEAFAEPMFNFRLNHYPPIEHEENEFGSAPHTDSSFCTFLPQSAVPGLQVRLTSGEWVEAPVMPEMFVVNSGDMLRRWTNHRYLSTPHRVRNVSGVDRYALPLFFDVAYDHVMECLPTCTDADNPPIYPPTSYAEYMLWFVRKNHHHQQAKGGDPGNAPGTSSATSPTLDRPAVRMPAGTDAD